MNIKSRQVDEAFFEAGELGHLLFERGGEMGMDELAGKVGRSVSFLQMVAEGRYPLDLKLASQIAVVLGIQVDEVMGDILGTKKTLTEHDLKMRIHDIVEGAGQPMNVNQVYQYLIDRGVKVSFELMKLLFDELIRNRMLIDANLPSYFAVG